MGYGHQPRMGGEKLEAVDPKEVLAIVHNAGFTDFKIHQVRELQEAFSLFDLDGGGDIDAKELGTVMRSLGSNPSDAEVAKMIEEVDDDNSGCIEFPEFCLLMARKIHVSDTEDELYESFHVFDAENTGFISLADLSYILSSITENLADDELAEIVALAESPYEAGRVSFDRFLTLMMLHKRGAPSPKPYKRGDVVDEVVGV